MVFSLACANVSIFVKNTFFGFLWQLLDNLMKSLFLLVLANENGLFCVAGAKKVKLVQYSLVSFFFKPWQNLV